jgi:hypothetical protein
MHPCVAVLWLATTPLIAWAVPGARCWDLGTLLQPAPLSEPLADYRQALAGPRKVRTLVTPRSTDEQGGV